MKVTSASQRTGEYVTIERNGESQVFTALYVRYASDDWELDREESSPHWGDIYERDELEQAYQEFISNRKDAIS